MVILWAVVPRRELGPLEKAAQLNRQKHLPQLEKETSPLAFGVKLAPRHNSAPPTSSDSDRKAVSLVLARLNG